MVNNKKSTQLLFSLTGAHKFPNTRYQGSKKKIINWIWSCIKDLEFETVLDAFGGTGVVSYKFKQEGKQVTYNDLLKFNYFFGKGLIENSNIKIDIDEIDWLLERHNNFRYPSFVYDNFKDIYFTDDENSWIDVIITNINNLKDPYKLSLAFFALSQTCIVKRPFNLFHRKNLYIRFAEIERSFGNKTSWDKPPEIWFRKFIEEANQAVFDNGKKNIAANFNALVIPGKFDLVYIDTPYINKKGTGTNYLDFYHFLEGLTMYDQWGKHIDYNSKHNRLKRGADNWYNKNKILEEFNKLFSKYQDSILVISYRSDGIPSVSDLHNLMSKYKDHVSLMQYGDYKYVLSKNNKSKEILLIGY